MCMNKNSNEFFATSPQKLQVQGEGKIYNKWQRHVYVSLHQLSNIFNKNGFSDFII